MLDLIQLKKCTIRDRRKKMNERIKIQLKCIVKYLKVINQLSVANTVLEIMNNEIQYKDFVNWCWWNENMHFRYCQLMLLEAKDRVKRCKHNKSSMRFDWTNGYDIVYYYLGKDKWGTSFPYLTNCYRHLSPGKGSEHSTRDIIKWVADYPL
jgi:hypothetical protein